MGFMPRPANGPRWDSPGAVAAPPVGTKGRALASLPLYGAVLFLGASLLFLVQPMFAKMVLPLLGGAPAVWNTAMVFFQASLLAGYVYAHLLTRGLPLAGQAVVHLTVLAAAFAALPIGVASGWTPPAEGAPVPWLIGLMAVSIGLPFFAVAATAAESFALTAAHPPPPTFVVVIFFYGFDFRYLRFHEGYALVRLRLRNNALRHERLQFCLRL